MCQEYLGLSLVEDDNNIFQQYVHIPLLRGAKLGHSEPTKCWTAQYCTCCYVVETIALQAETHEVLMCLIGALSTGPKFRIECLVFSTFNGNPPNHCSVSSESELSICSFQPSHPDNLVRMRLCLSHALQQLTKDGRHESERQQALSSAYCNGCCWSPLSGVSLHSCCLVFSSSSSSGCLFQPHGARALFCRSTNLHCARVCWARTHFDRVLPL